MNKWYIKVDEENKVIDGWSASIRPDKSTESAICINEDGGNQFCLQGTQNPDLFSEDNIPLYKWDGFKAILRTEEEISADYKNLPSTPPTQLDRIEAQVTYTAMKNDSLLEQMAPMMLPTNDKNENNLNTKIKKWFKQELWSISMLDEAVTKNILTQDEVNILINEIGGNE